MRDPETAALVERMRQRGWTPLLIVFMNDKEHVRTVSHSDVGGRAPRPLDGRLTIEWSRVADVDVDLPAGP